MIDTSRYEAFGEKIEGTGTVANKYLFAGEQFDEGLGDYYLRARYYDADSGRFTRRDTYEGRLAEPLTLHKYIYANANPVMLKDPSGFAASAGGLGGDFATALAILAILASIGAITYTATLENTRNRVCRYQIDEDHIFYPDIRFGDVSGFHSTARALEGYDFEWLDGCSDVVERLIELEADVDSIAEDGSTPLWQAAYSQNQQTIGCLLSAGAEVNISNRSKETPLHAALHRKDGVLATQILIAHGININLTNHRGLRAIHIATAQGDDELVSSLLANNATIS